MRFPIFLLAFLETRIAKGNMPRIKKSGTVFAHSFLLASKAFGLSFHSLNQSLL